MAARLLAVLLFLLGVVAIAAGTFTIVAGAYSIAGAGRADPSLESELRFYAAWYVAAGAASIWAGRDVAGRGQVAVWLGCGFWLAAAGRLIALFTEGRPHTAALVLLGIELALPIVLLFLYRASRR